MTGGAAAAARDEVVARLRSAGCVWAEDEADELLAAADDGAPLDDLVTRRVAGEPLEQVVGFASFGGLRVAVAPGVFVPRRRTELLVEVAAVLARPRAVVLDLCCGTGALGAALLARLGPGAVLHAADRDPAAVECARRNVPPGSAVYCGDLFDPLPGALRGSVDLLLANAPYVPSGEIALLPPEARLHENRLALDGGADGLDVHRRIAAAAPRWLAPGGTLLIEVGDVQRDRARALLEDAGLEVREHADTDRDAAGGVVLTATRPRPT
ncbi:putative protein N(5)-glutamine methyltransferase [Jatrophihabitans endophyticus]|uniref:putative protein N(5)-glutamine methyltransferase n=1 Tax=Jatrophihabitans endophyticus TaxID=1206085 RepID=UPI0019EDB8DE|nr:putative protein N(5)-glutamine methyltransferase [Jatrophihabitans endophyticus]MBE7188220.1 putative protein N(5)-glutamine methyltransferase [Jatrophihabitans endophyticus]